MANNTESAGRILDFISEFPDMQEYIIRGFIHWLDESELQEFIEKMNRVDELGIN